MGHYEDAFYEIYEDIDQKGLKPQFDAQVQKMLNQEKHKNKSAKEMWEYAHHKVTSSFTSESNLD
jgi:hypothetical protein